MSDALETKLLSLLEGEFSSLTIGFNDENAPNYQTVAELVEAGDDERFLWVTEEERAKAIETNRVWTLQWYPDTPNGFHCIAASSLSALIAGVDRWRPS